jgi:hypothetical protein
MCQKCGSIKISCGWNFLIDFSCQVLIERKRFTEEYNSDQQVDESKFEASQKYQEGKSFDL